MIFGIAAYIRTHLVTNDTLFYKSADDILWLKLVKDTLHIDKNVYVGLCYVLPEDSSRQNIIDDNIFDRLLDSLMFAENDCDSDGYILLCGDFNARTSVSPDFVDDSRFLVDNNLLPDEYQEDVILTRCSQDSGHTNRNGNLLLDLCKQSSLRILNGRISEDKNIGKYTFVNSNGSSVIDYVLCKHAMFRNIAFFSVDDPNILSDHCLVKFSAVFNTDRDVHRIPAEHFCKCSSSNDKITCKYVWDNDKKQCYIQELNSNDCKMKIDDLLETLHSCNTSQHLDTCLEKFENVFKDAAQSCLKNVKGSMNTLPDVEIENNLPWYNEECYNQKRLFHRMLNIYRELPNDENRLNMVLARSKYKALLRNARFRYDNDKTSQLLNAKRKNAKEYWNLLKQTAGIKPANIPMSTFEQYFKAINNPGDKFFSPNEDVINFIDRYEKSEFNVMFEELNTEISCEEINKAIKQLKTNRTAGPDQILNEFLISGCTVLMPVLKTMFNRMFEMGYFPDRWTEGYIIPLHKRGSIDDVANYRGITLLSCVGKLFTRILNNRLQCWAEEYNVYIEAQAGFRAGMSTIDNVFVLSGLASRFINRRKHLYCIFVDFTKAFDYVVRDNLWYKLIKLGVRGNMLDIIKSMYTSIKSRVKHNNQLGESIPCALGVRQGESLSPFLFSMFLNDLEDEYINSGLDGIDVDLFKIFLMLYADDIVLFAESASQAQKYLDILFNYCNTWKLKVNTKKTKIMIFRKGGKLPSNLEFHYDGEKIDIVSKFTYLGVTFTAGGSFQQTQNSLAGQAQKGIFKLSKYLYKFTYITPSHKLELFDKLISPILNYSSEVWGFNSAPAIEKVHLQFCKKLLGVKRTTQNDFVYGELGRVNYQTTRLLNIIKYWLKILHSQEDKYITKIYHMLKDDCEMHNYVNWCYFLKDVLGQLGFYHVWISQTVGDCKHFLMSVKQRLSDQFVQNWNSRINESSRALFYRNISAFEIQPYLKIVNVEKFCKSMSRLRVSSHRLAVETGRWQKPNPIPYGERICNVCSTLDDEFHFVLECVQFRELRIKYIPKFFWERPNMFKFIDLMKSSNENTVKDLSMFVHYAFLEKTL